MPLVFKRKRDAFIAARAIRESGKAAFVNKNPKSGLFKVTLTKRKAKKRMKKKELRFFNGG